MRVIVIEGHPDSERCAARCIESGRKFGIKVERFNAFTPADNPAAMFAARGWTTERFIHNRFSRPEPCMSCFLSHARLWHECAYSGESVVICEHDCVWVRPLPRMQLAGWLCNLGRPSFGGFRTPPIGFGPLISKPHMPGLTCYFIHHKGAEQLLSRAPLEAEPADVYVNLKRFKFLRESYPWPAVCEDDVSTIQGPLGIAGKHRKVTIV